MLKNILKRVGASMGQELSGTEKILFRILID